MHATLAPVLRPQDRRKGKKNGDRWRIGSSLASVGGAGCALSRWRDLGSDFLCLAAWAILILPPTAAYGPQHPNQRPH